MEARRDAMTGAPRLTGDLQSEMAAATHHDGHHVELVQDGLVARLHDIVVDCRHPASLARFWAAGLDGYAVAPYEEAELARLRANGINDPEDDPTVLVERADGAGPRLFFQLVPEPKTVKNRVHLDLRADDPAAEVQRLIGLGARVLAEYAGFVVLGDPEGNEF